MKKHRVLIVIMSLVVIVSVSIYTFKSGSNSLDPPLSDLHTTKKILWLRHWDEIDLITIKRKYQQYTVEEMCKMWNDKLIAKYGGAEKLRQMFGQVDDVYPQDVYLAHMFELGRPFVDFSDYENALTDQRIGVFSTRMYWNTMNTTERSYYLEQRGLPLDTTWVMYEEILLKKDVVYSINFWYSRGLDPYIKGYQWKQ